MERILVYLYFKEVLSGKVVLLTSEEENILMKCSVHAWRAFGIGFSFAGFAAWLATRRLQNVIQVPCAGDMELLVKSFWQSFTLTSATAGGVYGIEHSFGSSFERILNQEGTQIQQELGNVLVSLWEKYPHLMENIMKQHFSKHFYPEKVFDDLSTDGPKTVWRYRNFFGDGASTSPRTSQSGFCSENTDVEPKKIIVNDISAIPGVQRRDRFSNKENSTDNDTMADPFEWNAPQRVEDTENAASSAMSSRRHKRGHKRSHRRLISRREASTNMQHALADKGLASF